MVSEASGDDWALRGRTVKRGPEELADSYDLRGRSIKRRNTDSESDDDDEGTPFPRWHLPGYKITYPFKTDGDCLVWPSCIERQRAIMNRTVLPLIPTALQHYMSNNLDQDHLVFVRMVDICSILFHGTVFNFKFEAKPVSSQSCKTFFAQVHFGVGPSKDGHLNRCCLYDPNMPDIPYIHADCLDCFPHPPEGYQHTSGAGELATAVLNRVVRIRRNLPVGEPSFACYFLSKQEQKELLRYRAVGLAKLALNYFKSKTTNEEDACLEFVRIVRSRFFTPPMMMFNLKFKVKVKRTKSVHIFFAQVHRFGRLEDINCDAHVSVCARYDPNDPACFPSHCAVCNPILSREKHRYKVK